MAIRTGQFIFTEDGQVLLERLQNAQLSPNIPTERIKELGNYKAVATLRDTPDLSFSLQTFAMDVGIEEFLTGATITGASGTDLADVRQLNLLSQIKAGQRAADPFAIVSSLVVPGLVVESVRYNFAAQQTATCDISLRGDAIFWAPGAAYVETAVGTGASGQDIVTTNDAGPYTDSTGTHYALAVTCNGRRLTPDVDYTETPVGGGTYKALTITLAAAYAATDNIEVLYFSDQPLTLDQSVHTPDSSALPAAVRGKTVELYVGGYDPDDIPGSQVNRWGGVVSATAEWTQQVEPDYELGNPYAYNREANDIPDVTGVVTIRPVDVDQFESRLRTITGQAVDHAIGADSAVPLELDLVVRGSDGAILKRLHVPDARISVPGLESGQPGSKVQFALNYSSDTGTLEPYAA